MMEFLKSIIDLLTHIPGSHHEMLPHLKNTICKHVARVSRVKQLFTVYELQCLKSNV